MNDIPRVEGRLFCALVPNGTQGSYTLAFGTTISDTASKQRLTKLRKKVKRVADLGNAARLLRDDEEVLFATGILCNQLVALGCTVKLGKEPPVAVAQRRLWVLIAPRMYDTSISCIHAGPLEQEQRIIAAIQQQAEEERSLRALGPTFRQEAPLLHALATLQARTALMVVLTTGWNRDRGHYVMFKIELA